VARSFSALNEDLMLVSIVVMKRHTGYAAPVSMAEVQAPAPRADRLSQRASQKCRHVDDD
jgi:hypothetical protein